MGAIYFTKLSYNDFPLLLKWLETEHIKKWWDSDITYTAELIAEKYSNYVKGFKVESGIEKPISAFITWYQDKPIGYIQLYNAYDFPRDKQLINLPESLGAFDMFIGEVEFLGRNLGTLILQKFIEQYGSKYKYLFADPDMHNIAAIKTYKNAGFKQIATNFYSHDIWMIKSTLPIRLSSTEILAIDLLFCKNFPKEDKLWIFGSRTDLLKKGGDIDLYIETNAKSAADAVKMKSKYLYDLEDAIGEQKIDIVLNLINFPQDLPIYLVAKKKGVRII